MHDGQDEARGHFAVLAVVHQARNNLRVDAQASLDSLLGSIRRSQQGPASLRTLANASDEPIYTCTVTAQRAALPARPCGFSSAGSGGLRAGWAQPLPDPRLTPHLSIHGVQTALVVGLDAPVHTDRDHPVEVQFHWPRGAQSSHRLVHGAGCNAPASNASGIWVHVAEPIACANWDRVFRAAPGARGADGFCRW